MLASVDIRGFPEARTAALRTVDDKAQTLQFFTYARSPKASTRALLLARTCRRQHDLQQKFYAVGRNTVIRQSTSNSCVLYYRLAFTATMLDVSTPSPAGKTESSPSNLIR